MSLKSIAEDIAIAVAIAALAAGIGFARGEIAATKTSAAQVAQANQRATNAEANVATVQRTLHDVQARLAQQTKDLQAAQQRAIAALAARDKTQIALGIATRERIAVIRKAAHESPSCSDLARLPICPAVAGRLFPAAQAATPAAAGTAAGVSH